MQIELDYICQQKIILIINFKEFEELLINSINDCINNNTYNNTNNKPAYYLNYYIYLRYILKLFNSDDIDLDKYNLKKINVNIFRTIHDIFLRSNCLHL